MSLPDYQEVQKIVERLNKDVQVAELDGLVAGLLVKGPSVPVRKLMQALMDYLVDSESFQPDALQQGFLVKLVAALAEHAQELHALDDMEWVPLLPSEDASLAAQLGALAGWCAGFIHGCGIALGADGGSVRDNDLPGNVHELLADLAEISRVDAEEVSGNDAESDFVELLEYVRTAAFTCALELARDESKDSASDDAPPMAPASEQLQ